MSDCIWLCDKHMGIRKEFGFFPDFNRGVDRSAEVEMSYELLRRVGLGESIPRNEMPDRFFHSAANTFAEDIPEYFVTQNFFFKDSIADIFREFNLGGGYFHPVAFFQWDRETLIADDVYVLCPGNEKRTVDFDSTKRITDTYDEGIFQLPFRPKNDEIVTYETAADGSDIWVDKRFMGNYFFLSPRLADAIIDAGLKKQFGLVSTKTI